MTSLASYLVIGLIAAAATAGSMPFVIRIAKRQGWMATPDERRMHPVPTPDVGGIGMFIGILAGVVAASLLGDFDQLFQDSTEIIGVLVASAIIFGLGILDDIRDVSPPAKVTGIVVAAVALVWFGVTMFQFRLPFLDVFVLSDDWVPLITVLWLLGMTQAINLIDGLDGLAAGIVAIGAGAFFIYSLELTDGNLLPQPNVGPLVAIIAVGVCLGFLPFNFNPARIFMGDSGSLIIGAILAVLAMKVVDHDTSRLPEYLRQIPTPVFVMAVVAYPLVDTLRVFIHRSVRGVSPFAADRNHIHHRLLDLGLGHRGTTAVLYAYALFVIVLSLVTRKWHPNVGLMVLGTSAFALAMLPFALPRKSA